jgi:N-acetylneuraminic acid mutarotase
MIHLRNWTTKASLPKARYAPAVGVVKGILYAVGGDVDESPKYSNYAYNPVTDSWTKKAGMPGGRSDLGAGVINGILYAVGGWHYLLGPALAAVDAYDPATNS